MLLKRYQVIYFHIVSKFCFCVVREVVNSITEQVHIFIVSLGWETANLVYKLVIPLTLYDIDTPTLDFRGYGMETHVLWVCWCGCLCHVKVSGNFQLLHHRFAICLWLNTERALSAVVVIGIKVIG